MVAGVGISPIQVIYAVTVCNSVALASVLWRHRERPGAIPLIAHVLAAGAWAGSLLGLSAVEGLPALALLGVLFLAVGFSVMTLVVFTLEYTGRERLLTRSTLLALSVEPVLAALLAVVNPAGVFIRSYGPPVEWGIAFWLHTAYSYLLLVLVSALIFGLLYRSRSLYRGQSAALLGAVLASWIANVVSLFGPVEAEISPIGFLVAGGLFAVAIVRYRLTDIAPIARDRVLENVSDGIFVVDREDRLIDANPVGRDLLTDLESAPIGATVESLLADRPEVREAYRRLTATPTESERDLSFAGGHYHVRTTPIEDDRDRHVGWLFIVRDITDRKHRETQLERQNERLERFADIVSHDLRNPLTVADGHLDLARETGDFDHLDEVERSHERMGAIIDDVLALAREGESVTDPAPVAIAPLAEDAWAGVDTADASLSIEDPPTVLADEGRLRRLLENLFRNAVEHGSTSPRSETHEDAVEHDSTVGDGMDSSLTVSVGAIGPSPTDGAVTGFYVADNGQGLPEEGARVFEEGYTTDTEGTGFGLSIVERIATAHGWTVEAAESEAGGARFEFTGIETAETTAPIEER